MKLSMRLFAIILMSLVITGCQNQQDQLSDEEANPDQFENLIIYTTIYPLEFLANQIGGDHVVTESILPAGSDAHSFEPTSRMMVEIAESDLFIYNDPISESYAKSIKDALENEAVDFLEASAGLDRIRFQHDHHHDEGEDEDHHDHDHGDYDPHVWLSPRLMTDLAKNILTKLIELAPEHEAYFNENYDLIAERLTELDHQFNMAINQAQNNKILVTHAAYGYWEHDYDLEQIAITGISATEEPSQRQLAELIERIKELKLEFVLFEQNIQPRVATVIQNEVGLVYLELHNLAVLTEENIEDREDYFSLMERNIEVLQEALN